MGTDTKFAIGAGAALLALVVSAAFAPTAQAQAAAPAVPTPEQAVAGAVQAAQATYAGDCAGTRSPADAGKVCSKFVAERGNQRAYLVGRTFSEYGAWVFVAQSAGGWRPLTVVPFDESATALAVPWPAP